jgi:Mn-dependent DtxR family transcriptional regulator
LLKFCLNVDNIFEELNLTVNEMKYLKVIFSFQENKEILTLSKLSHILGIKPPSALDTLKNLENKGLVIKERGKIYLTPKGEKFMKYVALKRRILEIFFYHFLGLEVKLCKKEAEKIDFLVGCELINKMIKKLEKIGINLNKCLHEKSTYLEEFYKFLEKSKKINKNIEDLSNGRASGLEV